MESSSHEKSPSSSSASSTSLSPSKRRSKTIDRGKSLAETFDTLTEKIPKRPTPQQIERNGLRRSSDLADTLQPIASQVEKKIVESRVSQSIKKKSQPASPNSKRIISAEANVADSLAPAAKDLKMRIRADTVAHLLGNRPTIDDLKATGVVNKSSDVISNRIINVQKSLEASMKRDQVGHLLEHRPKAEDLKHVTGFTDPTAPSIRGRRRSLEFGINKSQLNRHLMERADYQQLVDKGIVSSGASSDAENSSAMNKTTSQPLQVKVALALKCASRLDQLGMIDEDARGHLKNLILANDPRVLAALDTYEANQNLNDLLDSMQQLAISKGA